MILGDLLGRTVECDGRRIGYVLDARFVLRDGQNPGRAPAELVGLVIGPRRRAAFLGYERIGVDRPRVISRWLAHRHRGSFLVDIDDVVELDDVVEVRSGFDRWSPLLP